MSVIYSQKGNFKNSRQIQLFWSGLERRRHSKVVSGAE